MAQFKTESTAARYRAERKQTSLAYLIWVWFGFMGGHRFYTLSIIPALGELALGIIGFPMLLRLLFSTDLQTGPSGQIVAALAFAVPMVGLWVVDGIRMPRIVERANVRIARRLEEAEAEISMQPRSPAS